MRLGKLPQNGHERVSYVVTPTTVADALRRRELLQVDVPRADWQTAFITSVVNRRRLATENLTESTADVYADGKSDGSIVLRVGPRDAYCEQASTARGDVAS